MSWKIWLPLALAVIFGLVAAKVGRDILVQEQSAAVSEGRLTRIVVAKRDLEPGHELSELDLALGAVTTESVPRNALKEIQEAVGRVVAVPLVKGQSVLEPSLAPRGIKGGLQALVPPGMRAVTVAVNETTGVGGMLLPGCRVDVISTLPDDKAGGTVARTIVENVQVIGVGQRLAPPKEKDDDSMQTAKSVTLAARPREAEALELASSAGRVRLVLRNPLDDSSSGGRRLTVLELLGREAEEKSEVVPVPGPTPQRDDPVLVMSQLETRPEKPSEQYQVEVIRGGVSSWVELPRPAGMEPTAVTDTDLAPVFPGRSR